MRSLQAFAFLWVGTVDIQCRKENCSRNCKSVGVHLLYQNRQNSHPIIDFTVICLRRITAASIMVITALSLSIRDFSDL